MGKDRPESGTMLVELLKWEDETAKREAMELERVVKPILTVIANRFRLAHGRVTGIVALPFAPEGWRWSPPAGTPVAIWRIVGVGIAC